jgi:replicative DNA helicase
VRRVAEEMRSVPFHCYSAGEGRRPPRIDEIVAFARAFKRRQRGLGMLIVDYLQIVRGGRGESMENRIADISATLKLLANELNCCVLALSQLNRDNEREGRRPTAADLRYSGAIEQDADAIALLHRPAQVPQSLSTDSRTDHEGVVIELLVVKNRHGSRGRSALFFREAITHFDEAPADIKPMNAKSPRYGGGRNVPASHEESDGERAE